MATHWGWYPPSLKLRRTGLEGQKMQYFRRKKPLSIKVAKNHSRF